MRSARLFLISPNRVRLFFCVFGYHLPKDNQLPEAKSVSEGDHLQDFASGSRLSLGEMVAKYPKEKRTRFGLMNITCMSYKFIVLPSIAFMLHPQLIPLLFLHQDAWLLL